MRDSPSDQDGPGSAFTLESASTYQEYLRAHGDVAAVLRARQREIRLGPDDQLFLWTYDQAIHMVAVAEPDSPATVVVLPVLARIAQSMQNCSFWALDAGTGMDVLRRVIGDASVVDELAARELPLLAVLDVDRTFLGAWGPHPAGFASKMDIWLSAHPEDGSCVEDEQRFTNEMRLWYNSGLNAQCVAEICALMESALSE